MLRGAYWAAFAAALAVYLTMLIWTLPGISGDAGGLAPFDLRPFGYSPDEARRFLAVLGDTGRAIYEGPQRILDLFYPALLAIVLGGAVVALIRQRAVRFVMLAAVLGGMVADYLENARVAVLLAQGILVTDAEIATASLATVTKSVLTGVAMVAVCIALAVAALRRVRRA